MGGGGAGALAALEASKHQHLKIILASKGPIGRSGLTPTANGGTAFHSSPDGTFQDMVTGGSFLNDQRLVWFMANAAEKALERLKEFGISTSRIREISVCVPPIELLRKLRNKIIQSPNIELLEDVLVTRLLESDGGISGATALDLGRGEFFVIQSKVIVIATGGLAGELYPRTSNNPFGVTTNSSGSGHAMAYLAGAELIDMEMIQFVPLPGNPRSLYLRYFPEFWVGPYTNRRGEVVESNVRSYKGMSYSHVFVQKIFREIEKGNGPIYIDQRELEKRAPAVKIKTWDQKRKLIKKLGIDPHENKIEIILGSHYGMGGIRVNERTETTIPGLFASGEVMGGVHGAFRMSGYSFTHMIVFGLEAGRHAARYALGQDSTRDFSSSAVDLEKERIFGFIETKNNQISLGEPKRQLQKIMEDHVFILRDKDGLEEAIRAIQAIKADIPRLSAPVFKRFNLEWARTIEFSLMVEVAGVIAASALAREESRGFHFRGDFPHQDDSRWLKHTVSKRRAGQLIVTSSPVELHRMKPEAWR
jgi:fumarate reductase (CoM/CoB) subunit A